jgi:hypothetical protein
MNDHVAGTSMTYGHLSYWPWWWLTFKGLHGIISQMTELFITIAVRTSNPTQPLHCLSLSYWQIPIKVCILCADSNVRVLHRYHIKTLAVTMCYLTHSILTQKITQFSEWPVPYVMHNCKNKAIWGSTQFRYLITNSLHSNRSMAGIKLKRNLNQKDDGLLYSPDTTESISRTCCNLGKVNL